MNKFLGILINIIFFSIVILVAFTVATIALTKKINEDRSQYDSGIKGTVVKQVVPVLSLSQGIVKKINVRVGQSVKKNDLIVEMENPVLVGKIQALKSYPDNVSAQTEARVAQEEIKGLKIYSPVDGVVTDISVAEGSPVEDLTKILNIYSNDNILLLANMTDEQYSAFQQLHEAKAYSSRLNQDFIIQPDILQPDEKINDTNQKTIGLYFTFKDRQEAASLLNNEDLDLELVTQDAQVIKPMDYIVNFWNTILHISPKKKHGK